MNLHKLIVTENNCYKAGEIITPDGIMMHSTAANNPYLKRYVQPDDGLLGKHKYNNHFNTAKPGGRSVCAHGFIGKLADGAIATYQILPWNYNGWHSGGKANKTHIGIEICEDDLTDGEYFAAVYKEAVELCVYLCKLYSLTADKIICHSEGYEMGIASNHSDVMHWFPKHGKSMDTFREDVRKALETTSGASPVVTESNANELYRVRKGWNNAASQIGAYRILDNAIAHCKEGYAVFNSKGEVVYTASNGSEEVYKVKVTADALNVRKGAGVNYDVSDCIRDKGVYTIVQTSGNWGKLKSGAGWINLKYTKKI